MPFYRIVVAEHSARVQGKFIDRLGHYNPLAKPKQFVVDDAKIQEWIQKGAQPTNTMARLLMKHGLKSMDKFVVPMADRKPKKAPKEAPAQASAPAAEAAAA